MAKHPDLVRKLVLTGTGPAGGRDIDKVAGTTYFDMLRATLTRSDPKELLFFNRNTAGKRAAKSFVQRLSERTADRDAPIKVTAFLTQLKAIKKWGRSAPADLSKITQPILAMLRGERTVVPGLFNKLSCFFVRFVTRRFASRLATHVLGKPRFVLPARGGT